MSFHTFPPGLSARVLALASCWPSAAIPPGRSSRVMSELRAHTQYMLCIQRKCVISRSYQSMHSYYFLHAFHNTTVASIIHTSSYAYTHVCVCTQSTMHTSVLCILLLHVYARSTEIQYHNIIFFIEYYATVILRTLLLPACSTRLVFELRAVVPQLLASSMQCIVLESK